MKKGNIQAISLLRIANKSSGSLITQKPPPDSVLLFDAADRNRYRTAQNFYEILLANGQSVSAAVAAVSRSAVFPFSIFIYFRSPYPVPETHRRLRYTDPCFFLNSFPYYCHYIILFLYSSAA